MTTLYFTKQFTSGALNGLSQNESMQFGSETDAAGFIKTMRRGVKQGVMNTSPWKLVDASFQKYWRH